MADKKYYWLKLQKDFFHSKRIKKLRSLAGGDTYTIIYLKMQLLSLDNGGILEYTGLEESFAKEIALDIDESPDDVQITVHYLLGCKLLETSNDIEYLMPYAADNMGTNGESTDRVRKFREKQKLLSNKEIDTEIDIEKEIEGNVTVTLHETQTKRFTPPSLMEVKAYCLERGNNIDPESFIDFYESKGWMVGSNKMKNWKAAMRTWEKRDRSPKREMDALDQLIRGEQ